MDGLAKVMHRKLPMPPARCEAQVQLRERSSTDLYPTQVLIGNGLGFIQTRPEHEGSTRAFQ